MFFHKIADALRGFEPELWFRDKRQAYEAGRRINAVDGPGKETPGEHRHRFFAVELARKNLIISGVLTQR